MTTLIDENAFGLLFVWLGVEDAEYGSEREEFLDQLAAFRETVLGGLELEPLVPEQAVLDLGHALYLEIADGDQQRDPIAAVRAMRARLVERELENTACVLTHGGRWVVDGAPPIPAPEQRTNLQVFRYTASSEPLRRAWSAISGATGTEEQEDGWGGGVYVDTEVIEALGKKLKNAPTPLEHGGATFYRFGG